MKKVKRCGSLGSASVRTTCGSPKCSKQRSRPRARVGSGARGAVLEDDRRALLPDHLELGHLRARVDRLDRRVDVLVEPPEQLDDAV